MDQSISTTTAYGLTASKMLLNLGLMCGVFSGIQIIRSLASRWLVSNLLGSCRPENAKANV